MQRTNVIMLQFHLLSFKRSCIIFSNNVLQTLKLLFKRSPPKGRKLLIIATATYRDILEQLGLLSSFSKVIHLSNMTTGKHVLHVLNEIEHCFNDGEMKSLDKHLHNKK